MSNPKIKFETVRFQIEVAVEVPVVEGKSNLRQEVDDMVEAMAEQYDFALWDYTAQGEPQVANEAGVWIAVSKR
jgi:hypothetical protein